MIINNLFSSATSSHYTSQFASSHNKPHLLNYKYIKVGVSSRISFLGKFPKRFTNKISCGAATGRAASPSTSNAPASKCKGLMRRDGAAPNREGGRRFLRGCARAKASRAIGAAAANPYGGRPHQCTRGADVRASRRTFSHTYNNIMQILISRCKNIGFCLNNRQINAFSMWWRKVLIILEKMTISTILDSLEQCPIFSLV